MLFGLIAVLLIIVLLLGDHGGNHGSLKNVAIASLSFGMGMVNPALSKIGTEAVSLTFMTGTLSRMGGHLAQALGGTRSRVRKDHGMIISAGLASARKCGLHS